MASRRRARLYALQALYARDVHHQVTLETRCSSNSEEQLDLFWVTQEEDGLEYLTGRLAEKEEMEFASRLFDGVISHTPSIDSEIESVSENWSLDRMSNVDRNILRLAVYELLKCDDIPIRVSLNEAIEISKKYSVKDASRFVNGILDKISVRLKPKV